MPEIRTYWYTCLECNQRSKVHLSKFDREIRCPLCNHRVDRIVAERVGIHDVLVEETQEDRDCMELARHEADVRMIH